MGKKIVMAFGVFDTLHFGHVRFLEYARAQGAQLVVVIARDANVRKIKGKAPTQNERIRRAQVQALGIATHVVLGHPTDYLARVRTYAPDSICLGHDQHSRGVEKQGLPMRIVRAPAYKPTTYKSSLIKKHTPLVRGVVGKGRGEGRLIGFPTANIMAPAKVRKALLPGIYASRVLIENREYRGATVVGVRTYNKAPLVETHILGLRKDIYKETITISLDEKMRSIRTYRTTDALVRAIQNDVTHVLEFYRTTR